MKLVARCLSPRFARLQAARRCAHTRRASPPDLDQAVLGIPRRCPNIKELYHFLCISMSTRLLSASSGSGHSGHPRWLSKPYMKLIIFMYQLASRPPDLDLANLGIPDASVRYSSKRLDRQASSEGASKHVRKAFGSTGVERERI